MEDITLEQTVEFYEYLKGDSTPDRFTLSKAGRPKLNAKKAFQIIYILQEHLRIIPDTYEQCCHCKQLFDTNYSGLFWESRGRHYCDCCTYLVPENYDKNLR